MCFNLKLLLETVIMHGCVCEWVYVGVYKVFGGVFRGLCRGFSKSLSLML